MEAAVPRPVPGRAAARFNVRKSSLTQGARPPIYGGPEGSRGVGRQTEPGYYDQEGVRMAGVRVLVGTKKGAFILSSDGKRERWDINGPHFGGWEIYHLKGSPVDPNRLYASQS